MRWGKHGDSAKGAMSCSGKPKTLVEDKGSDIGAEAIRCKAGDAVLCDTQMDQTGKQIAANLSVSGGSRGGGDGGGKGKGYDNKGKACVSQAPVLRCDGQTSVRAAPNPGEHLTRALLTRDLWSSMDRQWVLEFYGHQRTSQYGCFSNFSEYAFEFHMPEEFCGIALSPQERVVWCAFSEQAIMLCKAAAMGDRDSFVRIVTARDATPAQIKRFGRQVQGFDDGLWAEIECSVAYAVVYQKFSKVKGLKEILLATEDWVLAEATSNDRNWGIGLDKGDTRTQDPKLWQGTNMLGWALMMARQTLRGTKAAPDAAVFVEELAASLPPQSKLSEQEKEFLKVVKKVRDVVKLGDANASCKPLDKLQEEKLKNKHVVFAEMRALAACLPSDSKCLTNNKDVLERCGQS